MVLITMKSIMNIVFSTAAGTVAMDGSDYHEVYNECCI